MKNDCYTYEYIDPRDMKVFYVGMGKNNRFLAHLRSSMLKQDCPKSNLINEILKSGITPIVKKVHENLIREEALEKEKELIAFYGIENLTNKTTGGQGHPGSMSWKGRSHTEQTKEKMRQARLGKPGPKRTKEAIEKFKQTIKTNGHFGLGISRDEETKKKISNSLKGIVLTEEQKIRRSLEMKQVWEKRKLGLIPERKKRAKCQIHSMLDQNPITLLEI